MNNIEQEIREFLKQHLLLDDKVEDLSNTDSLLEKGIIDSTGIIDLVSFIEEKYNIKIDDEELMPEYFDSLQAISEFVKNKISGKQ
jgi:acyl carrier protein